MDDPSLSAVSWRESTFSGHEGGQCVEVADVSVRADA